jgi:hypothetical protein
MYAAVPSGAPRRERDVGELGDAEVEQLHHAVVVTSTFDGFTSRCTIPCACALASPAAICAAIPAASATRQRAAVDAPLQRLAVVVRHGEVEPPVVRLADLVDRADVRVLERGDGAGLEAEARGRRVVGVEPRVEET